LQSVTKRHRVSCGCSFWFCWFWFRLDFGLSWLVL
jgi:hypothetical protein